jgi:TRAP-type mannitol/chloroaromatic compound transport system permease small subunit
MLDRFFERLAVAASMLFLITMAIGCYEVIADKVFGKPTSWSYDLVIILNAICFMVGGAYGLQRGQHITISVVRERMRGRLAYIVDRLNLLIVAAYLIPVTWFSYVQAKNSIVSGETSGHAWDGPMPQIVRAAIFVGLALLILRVIMHFVERRPLFIDEDISGGD